MMNILVLTYTYHTIVLDMTKNRNRNLQPNQWVQQNPFLHALHVHPGSNKGDVVRMNQITGDNEKFCFLPFHLVGLPNQGHQQGL